MKKSVTLFTILLDYVLWLQQSIFIDAFDIYDQAFLAITPLILIRHVRNEKGTGAEMCPAILSGVVTMGTRRSAIGHFLSFQWQSQESLRRKVNST